MSSPLIQRLLEEHGYPQIDAGSLDEFVQGPGTSVLFFTGDPNQYRESQDVAVILPELVKAFEGRLRAAVVARSAERDLQLRYGFRRWPALVFLRQEGYLGTITGVQNWGDYLREIDRLTAAEPGEPPGFKMREEGE
jgi:hydrogenase-1 operon protein HyaE